jgi:CrcB protein
VRYLWIGLAGAAGALGRYAVGGLVLRGRETAFPWGTLVVNVSGCFLLGLVFTVLTERFAVAPVFRTALTVGFLGAYTTYSTFALETARLVEDGALGLGLANVALSAVAGLGAVWLGIVLGRAI